MHFLCLLTVIPKSSVPGSRGIVFYDGDCGFCQHSVQLLLRWDPLGRLGFAPLQGETARELVPEEFRQPSSLDTIVYVRESDDGRREVLIRSDAILQVLGDLGGWVRMLSLLRIVPRFLRDAIYALVAKNRMRLTPSNSCRLPTAEEQARFLP